MSSDEPIVLPIGTEVSAKYKGAFCEAKIKKVARNIRCKVSLKTSSATIMVHEADVQCEVVRVGQNVTTKYSNSHNNAIVEGTITKVFDQSLYTVVFDDGDEATLKRTSLCLKSGKHFAESETLDKLPLTNPEHFGAPVLSGRRSSRNRAKIMHSPVSQLSRSKTPKSSGSGSSSKSAPPMIQSESEISDDDKDTDSLRSFKKQFKATKFVRRGDFGRVVCVDYGDKRGSKNKDIWFPALVDNVATENAPPSMINPKAEKDEYTVRSFRDGRYYKVSKKDARDFNKHSAKSFVNSSECSSELREAIEKAVQFIEENLLPTNWEAHARPTDDTEDSVDTNEDESSNSNMASRSSVRQNLAKKFDEDDDDEDKEAEDNSSNDGMDLCLDSDITSSEGETEDEKLEKQARKQKQMEERGFFVAQLYKFMDDRDTPINHSPMVNGKELNLYKLHKFVAHLGGPTRVSNQNQWKKVFKALGLANADGTLGTPAGGYSGSESFREFTARESDDESAEEGGAISSMSESPVSQLKSAYKKYLQPFCDFNRKLGSTASMTDFRRAVTRPSRGERKREEERSRVNSTSSITSTPISTPVPASAAAVATARKFGAAITKSAKAASRSLVEATPTDVPPNAGTGPTTLVAVASGETSGKTPKAKPDERKRKKKDFDSDSNDQSSKPPMNIKDETEDDSQMTGPSSLMEGESDDEDGAGSSSNKVSKVTESEINIGESLLVKYGKGKQLKVYDAKVLKSEYDSNKSRYKYWVHYYGWSSRYDEWIYRNRIVQVVRDKSPRKRTGKVKNKGEPLPVDVTVSIDDEENDEDNKIEVVVRSQSVKSNNQSGPGKSQRGAAPPQSETPVSEKRNRNKEEPKERSASLSKVKSSDDQTRSTRIRTSSLSSQKDSTPVSTKKEKQIKNEDNVKTTPSTPAGPASSKRSKVQHQSTPNSALKDAAPSIKAEVNIKSEDESTPATSAKKKMKKKPDKPKAESVKKKAGKEVQSGGPISKRLADSLAQADLKEEETIQTKKRRTDDSMKTLGQQQQGKAPAIVTDAYEFVDDEELPPMSKAGPSTGALPKSNSCKFSFESGRRDSPARNRLHSETASDSSKSNRKEIPPSRKTPEAVEIKSDEEEALLAEPKRESPSTETKPLPPQSEQSTSARSFPAVESPCPDSNLQSSGEDQEVENILASTEAQKASEAEIRPADTTASVEDRPDSLVRSLTVSNSRSIEIEHRHNQPNDDDDDDDIDRSPLGLLVVAEDEEDERPEMGDGKDGDSARSVACPSARQEPFRVSHHSDEEERHSEVTQSADSGESNVSKEGKESTSSVDSDLLCEETVPASPPPSPPPPSLSSKVAEPGSLHHPLPSQTIPGETAFFRSQLSAPIGICMQPQQQQLSMESNIRMAPFAGKDSLHHPLQQQQQKPTIPPEGMMLSAKLQQQQQQQQQQQLAHYNTTPAFLANLHRTQIVAQAQSLPHHPPPPPNNQPFSTLIAAATSQQQVPIPSTNKPSASIKGPKMLNVIVPPNIASNIMKMDTSRVKARLSREEEETAENFADDEGPGMEVDDDDDDNDSDAEAKSRFSKKAVEQPLGRKRRAIRSDSKVSSSSSPAAGILSSQDSSQDGDDHSIDEELLKIGEPKKLRGKASHKSDLDLKNDDDSMSGCPSRMSRDLDSKSFKSPVASPKKRRRGRLRTISQSENRDTSGLTPYTERKERSLGYKTRGRHRHTTGPLSHADLGNYGSGGFLGRSTSDSNMYGSPSTSTSRALSIADVPPPEAVPYDYTQWDHFDHGKLPFMKPIDMTLSPDDRMHLIAERIEHVRKLHTDTKTKLVETDRKRKRAYQRKKERDRKEHREQAKANAAAAALLAASQCAAAAAAAGAGGGGGGSDSSSSSSKNERSSRSSSRREAGSGNASGRSSARLEEAAAAAAVSDNSKTGTVDAT